LELDQFADMLEPSKNIQHSFVDPTRGDWLRLPTQTRRFSKKNTFSLADTELSINGGNTWDKYDDVLSEENYKMGSLFNNLNEAVAFCEIIYNSEGTPIDFVFREVNHQYKLISGCNREELLGKTAKEHFRRKRIAHLDKYSRVAQTGIPEEFDTYFKDLGSYYNVQVFSPRKGEFAAVLRDISKRVDVVNRLRDSEKLNKTISDLVPVGIVYFDPFGEVQFTNKAFINTLEAGEIDKELKAFKILNKFQSSKLKSDNPGFIDQILSGEEIYYYDVEIESFSGNTKHINVFGAPRRGIGNEITGGILVCQDVTKFKVLHHKFLHAQRMEAFSELARGVVHDLNNLLTVIIVNSQLELASLNSDDPLQESLKQIDMAASSSIDLTGQLLEFSRKKNANPEVLEINSALNKMELLLRRIIGEDIDMLLIPDGELASVLIDSCQLEQIIFNLAVNARDAMPDGGKLKIKTRNIRLDENYATLHPDVKPGYYALIEVSDTGHGMPPEAIAQAFEPFFTTKETGKGTGIGLSTVYGIIEQCNGHVLIDSKEDQGTTFKIYIPAVDQKSKEKRKVSKTNEILNGNESILLVEDEEHIRETIKNILMSQGYQVYTASSGEDALEVSGNLDKPVDLLITDLVMPGIGGKLLGRKMHKRWKDMHILYMSGSSSRACENEEMNYDSIPYLQKPFGIKKLTKTIRSIFDSKA